MIRPYQDNDVQDLLRVWEAANAVAHPFLPAAFVEAEKGRIVELYLPNTETWVATRDGSLTGFIAMAGDEIGGLFVDPNSQRQGIGRSLVMAMAKPREALEVEVFVKNSIGRSFYTSFGFRELKRHTHEETQEQLIRMRWAHPDANSPSEEM